jgi:hypothetical protein
MRRSETSLGSLRVLSYPVDGDTVTFGPIGPNSAATLSTAMRHLRASRRDWDVIDLCGIDSQGLDHGRTRNALSSHGFKARRTGWQTAARIDFDQTIPIESLDESSHDGLEFVRHRPVGTYLGDADSRWDLFATLETLGDEAVSPKQQARRARHPLAVATGTSDLALLYQDDVAVAGAYGFHVDGHVEIDEITVAPGAPENAVTLLLEQLLADSRERDDTSYTFSGSALREEVEQLATSSIQTDRLRYFAKTSLRSQLTRLTEGVRRWSTPAEAKPVAVETTPTPTSQTPSRPQLKVVG